MADDTSASYARAFFRLSYPAEWAVRENLLMGLTDFLPPETDPAAPYSAGIALLVVPETDVNLDVLLRPGLFFITRDLATPSITHLGEQREGQLTWYRLLVRGHVPAPGEDRTIDVVKYVAVSRPGPGILVLALYGPAERIAALETAFEAMRRSVQIAHQ